MVDDAPDIHAVTTLVLKNKSWQNRRFEITSAYSKAEAAAILDRDSEFHVAIVDVVMESESSGLELCELIRETCPRSTRMILRTERPGLIPEEEILNEYDIDYYVPKSDISP